MVEPHTVEPNTARRERWLAAVAVALVVVFRSAVLVFWEQSQFDADQAIVGLMAKHLAELRAFPLFYYGQTYMLGVEAWMAAPVFLIAGASVTALKLPLLAINIVIALLLLRIFEREVGLRPVVAAVPTLFFALAAPGTASLLLAANGGNVEPLLYTLLLWLTRTRPHWCGFIFAVGFLQREFTLYALVALLAIEAIQGRLFTRDGVRTRLVMLRVAAEVWLVVQWLKHFSSAVGPGTTLEQLRGRKDNIVSLVERLCGEWDAIPAGMWALVTDHWPILFGARVQPLAEFGIESSVAQGLPSGGLFLGVTMVAAAAGIGFRLVTDRRWRSEYDACAYLILVAAISTAGYLVGRCGEISYSVMRYELLSLLGAAGLGAWFLRAAPSRGAVRMWIAAACVCVAIPAVAHARLLAEYLSRPPLGTKQVILSQLEARGIRYATSDYWLAYSLTFLAREQIIVASEDFIRIEEYQRVVDAHRSESIRISRQSWCEGARPIVQAGVYFCPPEQVP